MPYMLVNDFHALEIDLPDEEIRFIDTTEIKPEFFIFMGKHEILKRGSNAKNYKIREK